MKFFVFRRIDFENADGVTEFYYIKNSAKGLAPKCPTCGNNIGMLPPIPPIHVIIETFGSQWGDIAFGPGDRILASRRLIELLSRSGMSGLSEILPVTVEKTERRRGHLTEERPEYWLASIARSRTLLDEVASGLVREGEVVCNDCRIGGIIKRIDRIIVNEHSWDGYDIFEARGLSDILVTERFVRMCEENNLVNCYFTPADEFGFDFYRK
jgi:hypothetical protein